MASPWKLAFLALAYINVTFAIDHSHYKVVNLHHVYMRSVAATPQVDSNNDMTSTDLQDLQTFSAALGNIKAPGIHLSRDTKKPFLVDDRTFADFSSAAIASCEAQQKQCSAAVSSSSSSSAPEGLAVAADAAISSTVTKDPAARIPIQPSLDSPSSPTGSAATPLFSNPTLRLNHVFLNVTAMSNSTAASNLTDSRVASHAFGASDCVAQKARCLSAQKNAKVQSFRLEYLGVDPEDEEFDLYCEP